MFLDDEIVKMVIERKPKDYESEIALLNDIVKLCHSKVSENLHNDMRDENILPSTKKVCNSWDSACRTLEKKGISFLKVGGFRLYLLSKPELAKVLVPRGF